MYCYNNIGRALPNDSFYSLGHTSAECPRIIHLQTRNAKVMKLYSDSNPDNYEVRMSGDQPKRHSSQGQFS